jgi:hypothetical protein
MLGGADGSKGNVSTLDIEGNFSSIGEVSWWVWDGKSLWYYEFWHAQGNSVLTVTWQSKPTGTVLEPNKPQTITFATNFTDTVVAARAKQLNLQVGAKYDYDPEWYMITNPCDIAGSTWYDDVAHTVDPSTGMTLDQELPINETFTLSTYPYKSALPTPDLAVNLKDVFACALAFGTSPGDARWNSLADVNHDYTVNLKDYYAICVQFGWTLP